MFKSILVLAVVLCSLVFFRLIFLGESVFNLLQIGGVTIILGVLYVQFFFDKSKRLVQHFRTEILLLFIAVMLSTITPWRDYEQSFGTTLLAQRHLYFILFYFMLHSIKPSAKQIEQVFFAIGLLYSLFSFIQYLVFPQMFFDVRASIDRGTVRIFLPGTIFAIVSFFLSLNYFFKTYKKRYLIIILLIFSVFIQQGTRQVLFSVAFGTIMFILFNRMLKTKLLIFVMVGLSLIPLYFAFESIFSEMFAVTEEQGERFEDNIRVKAAVYFLTHFKHDIWGYLLGSGMDSQKSVYGALIQHYKLNLGFYLEDIGILGEFVRFGVLFIVAEIAIIVKIFRSKIPNNLLYIKIFTLIMCMTLFTGAGYFIFSISGIALLLYRIDLAHHEKQNIENNE